MFMWWKTEMSQGCGNGEGRWQTTQNSSDVIISMVPMKLPDDATTLPPPLFEDEALEEDGESPMTTEKGTDTRDVEGHSKERYLFDVQSTEMRPCLQIYIHFWTTGI